MELLPPHRQFRKSEPDAAADPVMRNLLPLDVSIYQRWADAEETSSSFHICSGFRLILRMDDAVKIEGLHVMACADQIENRPEQTARSLSRSLCNAEATSRAKPRVRSALADRPGDRPKSNSSGLAGFRVNRASFASKIGQEIGQKLERCVQITHNKRRLLAERSAKISWNLFIA